MTLSDSAEGLGGAGDDTLTASDDAVGYGLEGDDSLTGSDNASVMGGAGNDTLSVDGEALAQGGAGDDLIYAQVDAHGYGGEGDDILFAEDDAVITGGAGNDMLVINDGAGVTTPEQGDDIYVLGHADGGASLGFGYQGWDAGDRFAIHLGTNDLSNFRFTVTAGSQDGWDGPRGEITEIEITETLADGSTVSSMLSLRGVYGFNLRDITLYGENVGEELDWQPYFGENDVIEATGSETVYGGIGNDRIYTEDSAVGYGGAGEDRLEARDQSTVYGGDGADVLHERPESIDDGTNTSLYGGAGDDEVFTNGGTAFGGSGHDELRVGLNGSGYGGLGADSLIAGSGSQAFGDDGADVLRVFRDGMGYGGAGDDVIFASPSDASSPEVYGGAGNDLIITSAAFNLEQGRETIATGGAGADLHGIVIPTWADHIPEATATITDFDPAEDAIAVYVTSEQQADITVTSSFDAATNTTIVNVMQAFDTPPLSQAVAVFRLQGVQSFDTANLRFMTPEDIPA